VDRVWTWAALALALCFTWWLLPLSEWLQSLATIVGTAPVAGITAFSALYILGALTLAPAIPFAMAGGWLFGIEIGFVVVFVVGMIADAVPFLLARRLGKDGLRRIATSPRARRALDALAQHSEERGFVLVLLVRWFPLAPFNLMNYLLGFTRVSTRDYLWATAIACLPTTLLCVYAGAILPGTSAGVHTSPAVSIALVGLGMVSVLGLSHLARLSLLARGKVV
jgi:uncharacterized membrane protein YdjX (TVP38/TMEM64 family)